LWCLPATVRSSTKGAVRLAAVGCLRWVVFCPTRTGPRRNARCARRRAGPGQFAPLAITVARSFERRLRSDNRRLKIDSHTNWALAMASACMFGVAAISITHAASGPDSFEICVSFPFSYSSLRLQALHVSSAGRYLGIRVDDALEMAEQTRQRSFLF